MITAISVVMAVLLVQYARIAMRQNRKVFAVFLCSVAILCLAGAVRLDVDLIDAAIFHVLSQP